MWDEDKGCISEDGCDGRCYGWLVAQPFIDNEEDELVGLYQPDESAGF